tara:strand:- start:4205 stop:4996 length:792 start_codon:yes stop_codon:yes gene_type:complete
MIVDGKALAREISDVLSVQIRECKKVPVLGILMIAPTPETKSFVRIKKKKAEELGIEVLEKELSENVSQEEVERELKELISSTDGVVLQQPIPSHLNNEVLCSLISAEKDIDALTDKSVHISPVAGAIKEILEKYEVETKEVPAVVIGSGKLVGVPAAKLLKELGALVTVMTKETGIDAEILKGAKIIVSGAGRANLITKDMVSNDAIVIDAGTSESRGAIVGDVDKDCYESVALVSPVPGGVGPLTVVSLFKNLAKSASCSS